MSFSSDSQPPDMRITVLSLALLTALTVGTHVQAQDEKQPTQATKPLGRPGRDPNVQRPDPAIVNPKPVAKPTTPTQKGPVGDQQSAADQEGGKIVIAPPAPVAAKETNLPPKVAEKARDVVEKVGKGTVNWTRQFIEVKGYSAISLERFPNKAQARLMAIQGAKADAYRNLVATIKGVDVTSETTVEDMITTSDYISTQINGFVKGAEQVGRAREDDGAMEVTMRVPLFGPEGLANIVYDGMEKAPETSSSQTPQKEALPHNDELGAGITPEVAMGLRGSVPEAGEKQVAFNLKSAKLNPQLFPVFVNEKGDVVLNTKVLYDHEKGQFPQWLQLGKEVMNVAGFKKGVEVIDVVQNSKGEFVVPTQKNSTWGNVLDWAGRIGQSIIMLGSGNILGAAGTMLGGRK